MANNAKEKVNSTNPNKELKSLRNVVIVFVIFVFLFGAMVGFYLSPFFNSSQLTTEQRTNLNFVNVKQLATEIEDQLPPEALQTLTQIAGDTIDAIRPKREIPSFFSPRHLDPIEYIQNTDVAYSAKEKLREKRRAEMKLKELKKQAALCAVQTPQHCGQIFREIFVLSDEINTKFAKMKEIVDIMQPNLETTTRKPTTPWINYTPSTTEVTRNNLGGARASDMKDIESDLTISVLHDALKLKERELIEEVMLNRVRSGGGHSYSMSELERQIRKDIKELKRRLKNEKRRRKMEQGLKVDTDCGSSEELQTDGSCLLKSTTSLPTTEGPPAENNEPSTTSSSSVNNETTQGLIESSTADATEIKTTTRGPNRWGYWPTQSSSRTTYAPLTTFNTKTTSPSIAPDTETTTQAQKYETTEPRNRSDQTTSSPEPIFAKNIAAPTTEIMPRAFMDTEGHVKFLNNSNDDLETEESRLVQHALSKVNDGSLHKPYQMPKHRVYPEPIQEDLYRAKTFHGGHGPPSVFGQFSDFREMHHNDLDDLSYERDFSPFRDSSTGEGIFQGQHDRFDDGPMKVDIGLAPDRDLPANRNRLHARKPFRAPTPPHPELNRWMPVVPARRRNEDDFDNLSQSVVVNVPDRPANRQIERPRFEESRTTTWEPLTTTTTLNTEPTTTETEKSTQSDTNSLKRLDDDKRVNVIGGQFMNLCEQAIRERSLKTVPVSSVGQIPPTGQTSKAEAQLILTPGFNPAGAPICYFGNVPQPMMPNMYGQYYGPQPYVGYANRMPMYQPSQIAPVLSGPGSGRNLPFNVPQQTPGNYHCAFVPHANQQIPNGFGIFRSSEDVSETNIPSELDIVYASFSNQSQHNEKFRTGEPIKCEKHEISCASGDQCIPRGKWCDSKVDCLDKSDETACTCEARLPKIRICDGIEDCPFGTDEMGCFGCDRFSLSCYNSKEQYEKNDKATTSMCYAPTDRCDGFKNCINGKDEEDCSILVKKLGSFLSHSVSFNDGFLHHHYKGKWYPVCGAPERWAKNACESEVGKLSDPPKIYRQSSIPGPYISFTHDIDDPKIEDSCPHSIYVECPDIKCGSVKPPATSTKYHRKRDTFFKQTVEKNSTEVVGIVGGQDSSLHQWPFIVAIFRNGKHHCGGAIKSAKWVISAAHCFINYQKYYYEIRAGMLRRASYHPALQITHVEKVYVHEGFSVKKMNNDISLIELAEPLMFNRFVRPICMPGPKKSGPSNGWELGPPPTTLCTVIGWGLLSERGGDPDHLKEVDLPIQPRCKHDDNGRSICAGELLGGKDACQGDSGGPLICKSISDQDEYYLAGVVSFGLGCARPLESGVYTRVALYLDWLDNAEKGKLKGFTPIGKCPGHKCIWGGGKCLRTKQKCNGKVDCLGAEDEVDCDYDHLLLRSKIHETESEAIEDQIDYPIVTKRGIEIATPEIIEQVARERQNLTIDAYLRPLPNENFNMSETPLIFRDVDIEVTTFEPQSTTRNLRPRPTPSTERSTFTTSNPTDSTTSTTTEETTLFEEVTDEVTSEPRTTFTTSDITTEVTTDPTTSPFSSNFDSTDGADGPDDVDESRILLKRKTTTESTTFSTSTSTGSTTFSTTTITSTSPPTTQETESLSTESTTETLTTTSPTTTTEEPKKSTLPLKYDPSVDTLVPTSTTENPAAPIKLGDTFTCTRFVQNISILHRCDGQPDCEDGTDEENCTCRERLIHTAPQKICNGQADCSDLSDEEKCVTCAPSEFKCGLSHQCIPRAAQCNQQPDCQFQEDELDCITLSDGQKVFLTPDFQPVLSNKGFVTRNDRGQWSIYCVKSAFESDSSDLAGSVCNLLGFAGYRNFGHVILTDPKIGMSFENNAVDMRTASASELVSLVPLMGDEEQVMLNGGQVDSSGAIIPAPSECVALHIECVPHTHSNSKKPISVINRLDSPKKQGFSNFIKPNLVPHVVIPDVGQQDQTPVGFVEHHWPFSAVVLLEGKVICNGVLLSRQWVLVEESCTRRFKLYRDFVTVLLGNHNVFDNVQSPYEVIARVDCWRHVPDTNTNLLHLEAGVVYNRQVLPTFLIESRDRDFETEECVAVTADKFGKLRSWPLVKSDTNCASSYKCFNLKSNESNVCSTSDAKQPGVVICQTREENWFPTGFYSSLSMLCSRERIQSVLTLSPSRHRMLSMIDDLVCDGYADAPSCLGHRCHLGNCLPESRVCDGTVHCHDSSDEREETCYGRWKRECNVTELKCNNGKCVSKDKFCDGKNDCGDYTDEPKSCNCYTYLKSTDPSKICDGVRNCHDKEDENPNLCRCHNNRFRCGRSLTCVPYEFVCDYQQDCPNGEDERYCTGVKYDEGGDGYQEVQQQEFGVWHTKCFPKGVTLSEQNITALCELIGFRDIKEPTARVVVENETVASLLRDGGSIQPDVEIIDESIDHDEYNFHRNRPTKAVLYNEFSNVEVNQKFTLFMKPSKPLMKVVPWEDGEKNNCFRLEIKCY